MGLSFRYVDGHASKKDGAQQYKEEKQPQKVCLGHGYPPHHPHMLERNFVIRPHFGHRLHTFFFI